MSAKTGHMMKLYRNTGSVTTPVWTEVVDIGDVSIPDFEMGTAELKRRNNNFTKQLATLIQAIGVEFKLYHGLTAANFTTIKTNFLAGTTEEWLVADGDATVTGTQGLRLPAFLSAFPWDQPLEDVSGHDCKLACAYWESPAGTEIDPSWFVAS